VKRLVAAGLVVVCYLLGRLSSPSARPEIRIAEPPLSTEDVESVWRARPPAPVTPLRATERRAAFPLTDENRRDLERTPAESRDLAMRLMRNRLVKRCHTLLPDLPESGCDRFVTAWGDMTEKKVAALQGFLVGEIDQDTFQERYHLALLEQQVALESFLSPAQLERWTGLLPGEDPFMVVNDWFILAPGAKLGDDIITRTEEDVRRAGPAPQYLDPDADDDFRPGSARP
jgi:hypothetical protein